MLYSPIEKADGTLCYFSSLFNFLSGDLALDECLFWLLLLFLLFLDDDEDFLLELFAVDLDISLSNFFMIFI